MTVIPKQTLLYRSLEIYLGIKYPCIKCGAGGSLGQLCIYEFPNGFEISCRDCQTDFEIQPTLELAINKWNQTNDDTDIQ